MKRIMLGGLLLCIQSFSFVWADVTQDVQNQLNQGNKTSFRFVDNTIQTMAYLIEGEKGIKIIIALYTTNFTEPLSYQDSAFLKLPKFP